MPACLQLVAVAVRQSAIIVDHGHECDAWLPPPAATLRLRKASCTGSHKFGWPSSVLQHFKIAGCGHVRFQRPELFGSLHCNAPGTSTRLPSINFQRKSKSVLGGVHAPAQAHHIGKHVGWHDAVLPTGLSAAKNCPPHSLTFIPFLTRPTTNGQPCRFVSRRGAAQCLPSSGRASMVMPQCSAAQCLQTLQLSSSTKSSMSSFSSPWACACICIAMQPPRSTKDGKQ